MFFRELNRGKCKTYMLGCERTRHAVLIDPLKENTAATSRSPPTTVAPRVPNRHPYPRRPSQRHFRSRRPDRCESRNGTSRPRAARRVHVSQGDVLEVGDLRLKVLFTPGHTPDGISLYVDGRVFTGDTLLIGGTGRADFPGGDAGKQYDAIKGCSRCPTPRWFFRLMTIAAISIRRSVRKRLPIRASPAVRATNNRPHENLGLPLPDKIQEALQANQSAIEDDSVKFPEVAQLSAIRQITAPELQARMGCESSLDSRRARAGRVPRRTRPYSR